MLSWKDTAPRGVLMASMTLPNPEINTPPTPSRIRARCQELPNTGLGQQPGQMFPARAEISSQWISSTSSCSITHHPRPGLFLIAPSALLTQGSTLLAASLLHFLVPKSLHLHRVTTWYCSLHHPRITPCQGRSSKTFKKCKHKICTQGKTTPGTNTCIRLPAWKAALQKKP